MKKRQRRQAFTLIEVLIVVVILAIVGATVIPQITDSTDAKASTVNLNLRTLRSQIQVYRTHHGGSPPSSTLAELLASTDSTGAQGIGGNFPYGPYLREIPRNPISNAKNVTIISSDPAQAADVTGSGGWLYNARTGNIWIDNSTLYTN
jgi:general secretion pathway protein G